MPGVSNYSQHEIAERWAASTREYETVIAELKAEIERLRAQSQWWQRKGEHGCTGMSCKDCDT